MMHNKYCHVSAYCEVGTGALHYDVINPFPYHVTSDVTFVGETVPTPPRAASDRPRAPRYMIWMRTIDS